VGPVAGGAPLRSQSVCHSDFLPPAKELLRVLGSLPQLAATLFWGYQAGMCRPMPIPVPSAITHCHHIPFAIALGTQQPPRRAPAPLLDPRSLFCDPPGPTLPLQAERCRVSFGAPEVLEAEAPAREEDMEEGSSPDTAGPWGHLGAWASPGSGSVQVRAHSSTSPLPTLSYTSCSPPSSPQPWTPRWPLCSSARAGHRNGRGLCISEESPSGQGFLVCPRGCGEYYE